MHHQVVTHAGYHFFRVFIHAGFAGFMIFASIWTTNALREHKNIEQYLGPLGQAHQDAQRAAENLFNFKKDQK